VEVVQKVKTREAEAEQERLQPVVKNGADVNLFQTCEAAGFIDDSRKV